MSAQTLMSILTSGLMLGVLYALMAFGLAIVWTTLGIFNFAHGAFIAAGAYIAWQFSSVDAFGLGFWPALLASVLLMFGLGVLLQYLLIRPFERQAQMVLLTVITTLAGATIINSLLSIVWGPRAKQIANAFDGDLVWGLLRISWQELMMIAVVGATLLALAWFLLHTPQGRCMRAVAQNREAAQLMGLDVPRLYALTFGISAAIAGLAGVMIGSTRFMTPTMGDDPLQKALVVVILGGVARFTAPVYAAFLVGFAEAFLTYFVGLYWTPTLLFLGMIVVLVVKPEGLFGQRQRSV